MTSATVNYLQATAGYVLLWLLQPWAAAFVGGIAVGWVLRSAKALTLPDIGRAIVSGAIAWIAVYAIQAMAAQLVGG